MANSRWRMSDSLQLGMTIRANSMALGDMCIAWSYTARSIKSGATAPANLPYPGQGGFRCGLTATKQESVP